MTIQQAFRPAVLALFFAGLFAPSALLAQTGIRSRSGTEGFVGSPDAIRGGQLNLHTSEFPKSFNYFVNNASDAANVFGLVYDSLLEIHPNTLEFLPLIASSWAISKDKKVFTFRLDPDAKWADGKPITAEDVIFTYDTIMNPSNLTTVQRLSMSRFQRPEAPDARTVRFSAQTVHYNNLVALAGLNVLPKHLFAGKDFNRSFNMRLPAGSGPYTLAEVREGRFFLLRRKKDYWADKLPHRVGTYNFSSIKYKVIRDDSVAYEAFKKGDFDILTGGSISAKRWVTETDNEKFRRNWILKKKIHNYPARGFSGIAFNMRRAPFNDIRVRRAAFHLLDRKTLLDKIMFNQYEPLHTYWPALYGADEVPNPPVNYNPAQAKQLLREAGYRRLDREGFLVNDRGQRLEFTLIYSGESFEKHLTYYADTLKQAGVRVKLELLSWAALIKRLDEFKFDAVVIGWSGSLFEDPEQLWHSRHADSPGGSDLPGYKNPETDRLIDSLPPIFSVQERRKIIRRIDRMIYREVPYALFWDANYTRVFYRNKFGMPKTIFSRHGTAGDILTYWWFDPVRSGQLEQAERSKTSLPEEPVEVYYDRLAGKPGK